MGLGFCSKGRSPTMAKNASWQKTRETGICTAYSTTWIRDHQWCFIRGMISRPKTPSMNGLVGLLTQPLNHDCITNRVWVRARTVLRPRWMVIPSVTPAGECWPTVRLCISELTCNKIDTTTSLHTRWRRRQNGEDSFRPTGGEQKIFSKDERIDFAASSCLDWLPSSCFHHKQERWLWVKFQRSKILSWIQLLVIWCMILKQITHSIASYLLRTPTVIWASILTKLCQFRLIFTHSKIAIPCMHILTVHRICQIRKFRM